MLATWNQLRARLFQPTDIAPIVWFRVVFGLLMFSEVFRYFYYDWIHLYYVAPRFFFTYYGFEWLHPWSETGMAIHFGLLGVFSLAIAFGWYYRFASVLFFFGFTYIFLLDQSRYLNHFYLICLFSLILCFVPANRAFSLDVKRCPKLAASQVPTWCLWILRAQIAVVYFMGGIAKLNSDWLRGEPLRHLLARATDFPLLGPYLTESWAPYFFSYAGLAFDLGIVPALIGRKTRLYAFAGAAIFNLVNARLFHIGVFPWLTLGASIILFSDRLPKPWSMRKAPPSNRAETPAVALLLLWTAFQILVPLRHWFLYPGNPEWTEEGHLFSWRMMLHLKSEHIAITARNPVTGDSWPVNPLDYLTRGQLESAAGHPDMILQLSHHVAEEWRRAHGEEIEIRASLKVSLNGRPPALLVDPDVNLAAMPRTLAHANWIRPLESD